MESKEEAVTLSFLLSGSNTCLPPSYLKLRSYLNVYASNLAGYFRLKLPKSLTSKNTSCPFCYTAWTQNAVSFKLFPSPRKRKKETFSDQKKTEESIYSRNKLVLQCKLCRKKSSFSLMKKKNSEKKLEQLSVESDNPKKKKKKRKAKDKLSGLKLQCDKKVKKNNSSGLKNRKESLKCSNPSKVTTSEKATTQNLGKQKIPDRNKTNADNVATGNSKATKNQSMINPKPLLNKNSKTKKKSGKKFERLMKAISQDKTTAKTTLKDFLSLVSK